MKPILRVLAIAAVALSCEPARAACVAPRAEALIGRDLVGCCDVTTEPLGGEGTGLRWVAVSWWGPQGGKLFVVNCRGAKIAELDSLGYVERIKRAPSVGRIPTVAVTYVPETGTNVKFRSVALVQYRTGRPHVLWDHATLEAASPPLIPGPYEEWTTTWRFLEGRVRIEAVTVRTVFGKSRRRFKQPEERYCLRSSVWRYVACEK